ncbi:hypothetical protein SDC9_136015 [bioreactor metagenome]|uniref:Uncharacterized protein n=1 Tax=bioreactor metagenome TaxID=1076179 RepID=A0A645DI48_9ZZZZ
MILEHIAQRPGPIVVAAPLLHAEFLGRGDLYPVDILRPPERLENHIGEAQHQNILHRLLAQIVVDPVNLILRKHGMEFAVQPFRRIVIVSERFFQHHMTPGAVPRFRKQSVTRQRPDYRQRILRAQRHIEEVIKIKILPRRVDLPQPPGQLVIDRILRVVALKIKDPAQKFAVAAEMFPESLIAPWLPAAGKNHRIFMQQPAFRQIGQRRKQLALRQIASRPENHHHPRQRRNFHTQELFPIHLLHGRVNTPVTNSR